MHPIAIQQSSTRRFACAAALCIAGLIGVVLVAAPTSAHAAVVRIVGSVGAGSTLATGDSVVSPNGRFVLRMNPDGNLAEYGAGRLLWSSKTGGNSGAKTAVQRDGNVVTKSAAGRVLWHSWTFMHPGARLQVNDDGNVVVRGRDGNVKWSNDAWLLAARYGLIPELTECAGYGCETTVADRAAVRNALNSVRAKAGRPALHMNAMLNRKADQVARSLRANCRLQHSHLAVGAPAGWRSLAENLGLGSNITETHVALANSPSHRINMVSGTYNQVGTAAVWGNCPRGRTVFVVHSFMAG